MQKVALIIDIHHEVLPPVSKCLENCSLNVMRLFVKQQTSSHVSGVNLKITKREGRNLNCLNDTNEVIILSKIKQILNPLRGKVKI